MPHAEVTYHNLGQLYPNAPVPLYEGEMVLHNSTLLDLTGCSALMDWVADGQIPRALDVRKLPKVLEHEATRELLYNNEGKKAFSELKHYDAAETSPRFAAIQRMNTQLDRMTWNEYKMISENPALRSVIEMSIARLNQVLESVDNTPWGGKEDQS